MSSAARAMGILGWNTLVLDPGRRGFVRCRGVRTVVHGSGERGGMPSTVSFQLSRSETWERKGEVIGAVKSRFSEPVTFTFDEEFPTDYPEVLLHWFDCIFSHTDFFRETRDAIRAQISGFGSEMAAVAVAKGYACLTFEVKADEVVELSRLEGSPEQEMINECEEDDMISSSRTGEEYEKALMVPAGMTSSCCFVRRNQDEPIINEGTEERLVSRLFESVLRCFRGG